MRHSFGLSVFFFLTIFFVLHQTVVVWAGDDGPGLPSKTPAIDATITAGSTTTDTSTTSTTTLTSMVYHTRTPEGAIRGFIYPLIEDDPSHAISGCTNVTYKPEDILSDPMLCESHKQQSKWRPKAWCRRKTERALDEVITMESATMCAARNMLDNGKTLSQSVCSCLTTTTDNNYCGLMDLFATEVHCHDEMAKHIKPEEVCPKLNLPSLGVELSYICSRVVAKGIIPAELQLTDLLSKAGAIPDIIDRSISKGETRTYHMLHKALERLTRWADTHLFCTPPHKMYPDLEDIEVLPDWKSQMYIYIDNRVAPRSLPLGLLAQYQPKKSESISVQRWLLLIRDLRTTLEGRLFLTNRQSRKYLLNDAGPVHEGYDVVASSISRGYLDLFFKTLANQSSGDTIIITVAGLRNFGGGIATIVANDLAMIMESFRDNPAVSFDSNYKPPIFKINLVTFSAGPVGDFGFVSSLRRRVNFRNILSQDSAMTDMPCQEVRGCRNPETQIPTEPTGVRTGPFLKSGGEVRVESKELSGNIWKESSTQLEVVANMVCATPCWISTLFCPDDSHPQCTMKDCGGFISDEAIATQTL